MAAPPYDGSGLCGIDTTKPLSSSPERDLREYFILFQEAVVAAFSNLGANGRGEHDCYGRHLSKIVADVGIVNAYAGVLDMPSIKVANGGLYDGFTCYLKPDNDNTGPSTIEITPLGDVSLGVKDIKLRGGTALIGGELKQNRLYILVWLTNAFRLLNPSQLNRGSVIGTAFFQRQDVVEVVNSFPADGTIPQQGEGTEVLSVTYTPTDAANKLRIRATVPCATNTDFKTPLIALFEDGVGDAVAVALDGFGDGSFGLTMHIEYVHQLTSINPITFKVELSKHAGFAHTLKINTNNTAGSDYGAKFNSVVVVEEITP